MATPPQAGRHSGNSHSPPTSDPPERQKRKKKKPTGKKRGGQPGHQGHSRPLYPVEECSSVTDHYPETCDCCGEKLSGVDPNPYRHQVVEIPPIELHIEEHRLHQLSCPHCGEKTRAVLPEEVEASGYSRESRRHRLDVEWEVPSFSTYGGLCDVGLVWGIVDYILIIGTRDLFSMTRSLNF